MKVRIVSAVILLVLCISPGRAQDKTAGRRPVPVMVSPVLLQPFSEFKEISAKTSFFLEKTVSAEFSGKITLLGHKPGQAVSRGQEIAVIQSEIKDQAVQKAREEVAARERILFQRRNWKERSAAAEKQAENNLAEAREELKLLEERAGRKPLLSPVDGLIAAFLVDEGQEIKTGDPVMTLLDAAKVRVLVKGDDAAVFKTAERYTVRIVEIASAFPASVHELKENLADIRIENIGQAIKPGMTAQLTVLLEEHEKAVVIPAESIAKDDIGAFVFTVFKNRARKTYINIGPELEGEVLVRSGLQAGEILIKPPLDHLADLQRVKIVSTLPAELPAAAAPGKAVRVKPAATGFSDSGFAISAALQSLFARNAQLEGIAEHFNNLPAYTPLAEVSSALYHPSFGVLFNFNNKFGIGLNFRLMSRSNDIKGASSSTLAGLTETYNYSTNKFDESYTGVMLKGYYYFINNDRLALNAHAGLGLIFGSFKHINQVSYSLRDGSRTLYSFAHSGNIEATASGLNFLLGSEFEYKFTENLSLFAGLGFDYISLKNWNGTYQYENDAASGTDSGDLYYVVFGSEHYLWILSPTHLATLESDPAYVLEPAQFITSKRMNFLLSLGLKFRFGSR